MRAAGMTSQSCHKSPRLRPKSWDLIFCGGQPCNTWFSPWCCQTDKSFNRAFRRGCRKVRARCRLYQQASTIAPRGIGIRVKLEEAGPVRLCRLCSQYNRRNHRSTPIFGSKKVLSSLLASEHNVPSLRYSQIEGKLNSGTPLNGELRS